jgi:hypothetical protein
MAHLPEEVLQRAAQISDMRRRAAVAQSAASAAAAHLHRLLARIDERSDTTAEAEVESMRADVLHMVNEMERAVSSTSLSAPV